ncbi:peptidoglycan-recognition protein SD [Anastrepha ludens]|uniref:peptidoglycan-recognition protein SD n=1 Tax=Anastrepha ludens TaxID=28586 RepID=UPI0023B1DC2E|nr:peptidoglycan-recognition protein SD [Anastrepha ludens]
MRGIRANDRLAMSCGELYAVISRTSQTSVKSTAITNETNERAPLLKDSKSYGGTSTTTICKSRAGSSYCSDNDSRNIKGDYDDITSSGSRKHRLDCCAYMKIMTFVSILGGCCVIATYLLIAESRSPTVEFSLDLVHRDLWSNVSTPIADSLNYYDVENIVIMQTGGLSCVEFQKCLQTLRELQREYQEKQGIIQELPFNFLIGGDRQTYEARGWNYESGLPLVQQNASLVIAFIGNYTILAPSSLQLRSAVSLIAESVRRKKLQSQYKIFGLRNLTNGQNDGKALFGAIGQWQQFAGLI